MNARYRDTHGEVATTIINDGKVLSMVARGVEFRGSDFDSLEPDNRTDPKLLIPFTLLHGCLCACTIEYQMPLPVVVNGDTIQGSLSIHLELGEARPNGSLNREVLKLELTLTQTVYHSRGTSGWFEDELLDIQRQLPDCSYLKACITCAFSDYSPVGHGLFGGLACFRHNKPGYWPSRARATSSKSGTRIQASFKRRTYAPSSGGGRLGPGTGDKSPFTLRGAQRRSIAA